MDAHAMTQHISDTFDGLWIVEHAGDTFFLYDPSGELPDARRPIMATVVTSDQYDVVSDLDHPGAYRVNIGLTKEGYTERFGRAPTSRDEHGVLKTGYDYSVRDRVLPHPHYASQHFVCVVNPGENTLEDVLRMLHEAHGFAARKYERHVARQAKAVHKG